MSDANRDAIIGELVGLIVSTPEFGGETGGKPHWADLRQHLQTKRTDMLERALVARRRSAALFQEARELCQYLAERTKP